MLHNSGTGSIKASAIYLQNFLVSLNGPVYLDTKGKAKVSANDTLSCSVSKNMATSKLSGRWEGPAQGTIKLNLDAAFMADSGLAAMGAVLRDFRGNVIWSFNSKLQNCQDPEEAEANAMLKAIQCCDQVKIRPDVIETDCAALKSAVEAPTQDLSRRCYVYREIQKWLWSGAVTQISLVKRDGNQVAHHLARCVSTGGELGLWPMSVPECVLPFVQNDLSSDPML